MRKSKSRRVANEVAKTLPTQVENLGGTEAEIVSSRQEVVPKIFYM
jgi:hypothetical protein